MTAKQLQSLLLYLGYYTGDVDGIWGTKSREAAVDFQRSFGGLAVDGIPGPATQQALKQAVARDQLAEAEEGPEAGSFWEEITYFTREEFRCTCAGRGCSGFPAEPEARLVRNADAARKHFGKAASVSSGVRCRLRNSELPGSAANSLHMRGRAMDFRVAGISSGQLLGYVKTLPEVVEAYAIDESYVHMGVQKGE